MTSTMFDRRTLMTGAAAAATAFPLRSAFAQAAAAEGDWLAMVKSQHTQISTASGAGHRRCNQPQPATQRGIATTRIPPNSA